MEQIRKGNDIKVYWEIITGGDGSEIPYELEGKALELYAQNAYEKVRISDFVANGNVIEWTFYGKDQKTAGVYSLTLIENNGSEGMRTVDECNAFELVTHSCKTGGDAESRVSIETVRLRSVMTLSDVVPDKELNKNSTNVVENGAIAREFEKQKDALAKKQDIIPDLAIIREGASKGATALQEHQDISGKADTSGRYPDMSVGFSDDLVGRGESVPAEFSFRASGGKSIKDGAARIKQLKGNSVVWNQGFPQRIWSVQDGTLTIEDNTYIVTPSGEYPGIFPGDMYNVRPFPTEKVLVELDFYSEGNEVYIGINLCGNNISDYNLQPNTWQHIAIIATCDREDPYGGAVIFGSPSASVLKFKNMRFHNLTKMFGAGYEPTTIEEYNARKPIVADEYAYNEGEVIHMTAEGVKSVGDNAWDEEWENGTFNTITGNNINSTTQFRCKNLIRLLPNAEYHITMPNVGDDGLWWLLYDKEGKVIEGYNGGEYMDGNSFKVPYTTSKFKTSPNTAYGKFYSTTPFGATYNHDIMISLMHSGWKADTDAKYQPYWEDRLMFDKRIKDAFPNGMQRWNMVYNKNGKGYIVKGMGVVEDMSKMDWERNIDGRFQASIIGALLPPSTDMVGNIMCNRYATNSANDTYLGLIGISLDSYGYVWVRDDAYTDAASLKESLQGVPLYYQLAEPTIIEYDEPFNLDYKVADFGTEEIIAPQPSAPISADIIYQFNAVDMIREHELEITELQRIIATMQAQLTSLTSNNGGQ